MSALPEPRRIELDPHIDEDGHSEPPISLRVYEAGSGPAVVLSHGFPELAYSWRHQIRALLDAGFRVIAPDQRGYGESDAPEGREAYDIDHLTGDLVRLLDALGEEKAVFAGHDWGGFVVWAMPLLHPDRTAGVIGVNTPYSARMPLAPTQAMRMVAGEDPDSIYILWFQHPGVAETELARDPRLLFEKLMRRAISPDLVAERAAQGGLDMNPFRRLSEMPTLGESLLSEEDLDFYSETFQKSGFRGSVSWYRNFDRNWERHPQIGVARIEVPCLMVTAEWDLVLSPAMAEGMDERCSDLEKVMIEGCGHWTQQEKPEELNALMIRWLRERF